MKALGPDKNFLGLEEEALYQFDTAKYVIQPVPYEYTSSYLAGSAKGPEAIIQASQFVEFYDEELDQETIRKAGIATIEALDFTGLVDQVWGPSTP
jgi:agmatinase